MNFLRANRLFIILTFVCVAFVATLVIVSSIRELNPLESILLQVLILGTGVWATYLISQQSAVNTARDLLKPSARSAFRRAISLYRGLYSMKEIIGQSRNNSQHAAEQVVDLIEVVVNLQINTAEDALEDWRDLVPDEVADLESALRKQQRIQVEDHWQ